MSILLASKFELDEVPALTTEDVAARLKLHPRTVLRMAARGTLPAVKLGRRTVRFNQADIDRIMSPQGDKEAA